MLFCFNLHRGGCVLKNKAFTLMEVLVVMVILGVLASVAIPSYATHIERVRSSEGVQSLTALLSAQKQYQLEDGASYAGDINDLDITIAASGNFAAPAAASVDNGDGTFTVATISRASGAIPYVLSMIDNGVVTCACAGCTPANICAQLGY